MEKRVLQLEEAIDLALEYLEELMGNDYYESETIKYILKLYNDED